ncbi:hypothetical protein JOF53_006475 [Crossiella equi]|uniref:Uncharacterized protein n=1 Tax=Crossiella equi TaxID=130796 RepID=A0ABS5AM19_9PSEU|nr:hypothetical protein [Crossiella equi]MBP2477603.1 hypothetical protein [Crossiella equi]
MILTNMGWVSLGALLAFSLMALIAWAVVGETSFGAMAMRVLRALDPRPSFRDTDALSPVVAEVENRVLEQLAEQAAAREAVQGWHQISPVTPPAPLPAPPPPSPELPPPSPSWHVMESGPGQVPAPRPAPPADPAMTRPLGDALRKLHVQLEEQTAELHERVR